MSTFSNEDHQEPRQGIRAVLNVEARGGRPATVDVRVLAAVDGPGWYATGAVHHGEQHVARTFRAATVREAWAAFAVWASEVLS